MKLFNKSFKHKSIINYISHINYFFKLSTVSFVGLHNLIVLSAEADTKVVLSYKILIALTD